MSEDEGDSGGALCPCGKVRHPSRRVAAENLKRVRRKVRARNKDRGTLQIYVCGLCGGFHIGNDGKLPKPRAGRPRSGPPEPILGDEE